MARNREYMYACVCTSIILCENAFGVQMYFMSYIFQRRRNKITFYSIFYDYHTDIWNRIDVLYYNTCVVYSRGKKTNILIIRINTRG